MFFFFFIYPSGMGKNRSARSVRRVEYKSIKGKIQNIFHDKNKFECYTVHKFFVSLLRIKIIKEK